MLETHPIDLFFVDSKHITRLTRNQINILMELVHIGIIHVTQYNPGIATAFIAGQNMKKKVAKLTLPICPKLVLFTQKCDHPVCASNMP